MSRAKFVKNCSLLVMKGIEIKSSQRAYSLIDVDNKGYIYFHELYLFAIGRGADFSEV
jgi:Ca2+-binding EF-hand superfamily protein